MLFTSRLRSRTHSAIFTRRRSPLTRRQQAGLCPRLEALEDRSMMSGMPYPTAATGAQLVADISYADSTGGAYIINLQPSTTINVTTVLPNVGGTKSVDLTILGNGDTIPSVRFVVAPGSSLTLEHVTLQSNWQPNGYTNLSGGAIYNQGTVTVTNGSVISGNGTGLRGHGGAIYNDGGTVTIANGSTLSDNGTNGGYGGGIYNNGGTVTVSDSTLSGNTAIFFTYFNTGGLGGAIYNNGGTVTIDHSILNNNSADTVSGGIYNNSGTVTVRNSSSITGNHVNGEGGPYIDDVNNYSLLYLDSSSEIGTLYGNPAIPLDPTTTVVATKLFYRGSTAWDITNNNWPGFGDDNAIAPDKTAYLPGSGAATFSAVSSYTRGINGLMIDLAGTHGTLTANDFIFKTGNNNSPSLWATATAPTLVTTRNGAGTGGSDRVELMWADNAIQKTWLEVIVKGNDALGGSNTNTAMASSYVFFWGNALADSGTGDIGSFVANSIDEQSARNDPHSNANKATITDVNDFNRDGLVNTTDQQFTRSPNTTSNATAPKDINISAAGPFAPVDEEGAAEANSTTPLTVPTGDSGISSGLAAAALLSIGSDAVPEPWEPYRPSESTVVITVPLSTGLQLATLVDIADPAFRLDDADWLEGISADDRLLVAG